MSVRTVDWTPEHLEILRLGVAEGLSYSQIAKKIPGCSRCGAIGKANRMGYHQPGKASRPTRIARAPPPRRITFERTAPPPLSAPRAPRAVIPFRDEPPGCCTILTIGHGQCKWPLGDPRDDGFTLCGKPAEAGPYCEEHHVRSRQAIPPNRPQTGNDLARSLRRYL